MSEHEEQQIKSYKIRIEFLRVLHAKTENPLYVWEAIRFLFLCKEPLPDWCMDYLKNSAEEVFKLIRLHYPIPAEFGVPDGKGGFENYRRMESDDAARKIVTALGIQRQGWNAFAQRAKDVQRQEDAALFDGAVQYQHWREIAIYEGYPDPDNLPNLFEEYLEKRFGTRDAAKRGPDRAIEAIKKTRGIEETKQARKRIREGKELLDPNEVRKPRG